MTSEESPTEEVRADEAYIAKTLGGYLYQNECWMAISDKPMEKAELQVAWFQMVQQDYENDEELLKNPPDVQKWETFKEWVARMDRHGEVEK